MTNSDGIIPQNTEISKLVDTKTAAAAILSAAPVPADHDALYQAAHIAVTVRGWSVVPVRGDLSPDAAKAPAVTWEPYQQTLPTAADLREWFTDAGYPGLAVVCGDVSNLYVIECDDLGEYEALIDALPFVQNTYTILSANRGLPHFYLTPPPGADLTPRGQSGKLEGRGNGQIVVTFPTSINGKPYRVLKGGDVLALTAEQWAALCDYFESRFPKPHAGPDDSDTPVIHTGNADQLVSLYHAQVNKHHSRNDGLFAAACIARDNGWTSGGVASVLLAEYEDHAPLGQHTPETPQQRRREGAATIASAFKRSPRPQSWANLSAPGLPTALREHFLKTKNVSMARILDTLLLAGVQPGHILSQPDIVTLCEAAGIAHTTTKTQLKDTSALRLVSLPDVVPDGTSGGADDDFFSFLMTVEAVTPDENTPQSNLVTICPSNKRSGYYCVVQGDISLLNSKGRKPAYYQLPTIPELCAQFGVSDQRSDPLPFEALAKAKDYRQAVTEALIKRRPGEYSQHWLGERVGVSARTVRRHVQENEAIKVTPQVDEKPITEANITDVPADLDSGDQWGHWLQDETGKKYPPRQELAQKLLGQGRKVFYCKQLRNHYQHVDNAPVAVEQSSAPAQAAQNSADAPQRAVQGQTPTAPADAPESPDLTPDEAYSRQLDQHISILRGA